MFLFLDIILTPEPKSVLCWETEFLKFSPYYFYSIGKTYIHYLPCLQHFQITKRTVQKHSNRMELNLEQWDFRPFLARPKAPKNCCHTKPSPQLSYSDITEKFQNSIGKDTKNNPGNNNKND